MAHRSERNPWRRMALGLLLLGGGLFGVTATAAAQEVPPQSQIINQLLKAKWDEVGIKPSRKATDHEFIRRVFIDLIGRVATPEEVRDFEADKSPNKRAKLVHRLLYDKEYQPKLNGRPFLGDNKKPLTFDYNSEYARHWANVWSVWLMTRGGLNSVYHDQMRLWLEEQFSKNIPHNELVEKLLTATGKSNDNAAVNFVLSHMGESVPAGRRKDDGSFEVVPITSRVTKLFLGVQTQCTQCHDHPFSPDLKQEHFWGVNAFFRQVSRDRTPTPAQGQRNQKMPGIAVVTLTDDPNINDKAMVFYERRSGVVLSTKPVFLPNLADLDKENVAKKSMPSNSGKTRRQLLAEFVLNHDNFARAYVNRMWAQMFGRGMNEQAAFDDFGAHNKVVHQELLDKLAEEVVKYKYDTKALLTWICNSDAYNLSYAANPTNKDPDKEAYYSRMLMKSMSPEVLFESLMEATRSEQAADKDTRKTLRQQWMNRLVRNFGDDEGNEVTFNGTIVQALLMMNGKELNSELTRKTSSTVERAINRHKRSAGGRAVVDERAVIDELYLAALNRRVGTTNTLETEYVDPRTKRKVKTVTSEAAIIMSQLGAAKQRGAADFAKDPMLVYKPFFEDVFWALLNTNEFILNH